jgi:hypothetical protein
MKRIKSACLFQTIHFQLKDGLPKNLALRNVKDEYESYKKNLDRNHTRYQIVDETEQEDGSILIHIKKQYNSANCDEYMN